MTQLEKLKFQIIKLERKMMHEKDKHKYWAIYGKLKKMHEQYKRLNSSINYQNFLAQ